MYETSAFRPERRGLKGQGGQGRHGSRRSHGRHRRRWCHERHSARWSSLHGRSERFGSFTYAGKAGKNRFTFRGRAGGKSLKPGSFRLNSQATDKAKNTSPLKRKGFKIVK